MVKFNLEFSSNNIFGSFSFSIVHVELKKQICLHVLLVTLKIIRVLRP